MKSSPVSLLLLPFTIIVIAAITTTCIIITTFVSAFETENEQKLKKFGSHIKAISSRPRNATLWKLLANELHPGESFTSFELGGKINKMSCLTKALEMQPGNADNWVELGFALLDPRQRMFSGSSVSLNARSGGGGGGKKDVNAQTCFIKAVEADGGTNARAWLGLSKVIMPKEETGDARIEFPDGETSFSRLDCLKKALAFDSTSKEVGSVAWFDLGAVLKRRKIAGQRAEISLLSGGSDDGDANSAVNSTFCFQRAIEINFENAEAWLQLADTILSPEVKALIRNAEFAEEKQKVMSLNATLPMLLDEDKTEMENVDARKMLIIALRFNSGLGDAWHLLSEIKQTYAQAESERKWIEKRKEEAKLRKQQEKSKKDEANAVLNEGFDEDEDEDEISIEDKEKKQDEYENGSEEEQEVRPFLDSESHHKVAGDDVWKHSRQECLQGALEAVRPTTRVAVAWFQLAEDLKDRNDDDNDQQQKQEQEEARVYISGAPMRRKGCLVAALVNDKTLVSARKALCEVLQGTTEEIPIKGEKFSFSNSCSK